MVNRLFAALNFKGSVGRADLLVALAMAHGDSEKQNDFASVLGFEPQRDMVNTEPGVKVSTSTIEPEPLSSLTQPNGIFRPYQLVRLDNAISGDAWRESLPDTSFAGFLSTADMDAWDNRLPLPTATPIVPWTRLWPRLRQAVARRHDAGIDFKRLTERLARGLPVRRLPRGERLAWPQPLPVVLDFSDRMTPYWDDWHRFRRDLQSRLHRQVCFYRLDGVPQRPLQKMADDWSAGQFLNWPKLALGDTLLLASDLGMVDPNHPWPVTCWQSKLNEFRRQGVRIVVLAPVSARHLRPSLVNCAALLRLSPDSSLRIASRMPPILDEISGPKYDLYPAIKTLLAMMSVATRVEPALLRGLRGCLPDDGRDAGLDGEIWCHQELDTASTACALTPWAVQTWRELFNDLPEELQQRTLDCLRNWHAHLPQAIHHEETLLWHHLAQIPVAANEEVNAERARRFFIKMKNTLAESDISSTTNDARVLQIQLADRHVEWMAPTLGASESYLAELSTAVAQAAPQRLKGGLPAGIDPVAWLKALPLHESKQLTLLQNPDMSLTLDREASKETIGTGTAPLAVLHLDRSSILWAFAENNHALVYRPWHWETLSAENPPELPSLWADLSISLESSPKLYLHTGRHVLHFEKPPKLPHEIARAQDCYGLYADLELHGIVQRFRWINPGEFMMGSPADEPERLKWELQHSVTLRQGFWLADSACTQALWRAVTGENPSRFQDNPENPVENVSWDDVQHFFANLNRSVSGLDARLPTEAEWEYACRAGTATPFSFGDNITPEQVNYNGEYPYANGAKGLNRRQTVPVKSLPPNPWGLHEMHGNVWEWCQDWHSDYGTEPQIDPTGPEQGTYRMLRGGSWTLHAGGARSADRGRYGPAYRRDDIGFRLALGPEGASGQEGQGRRAGAGRTAAAERGGERIQKVLNRLGHGSLREIEDKIRQGRIFINGERANLGDHCYAGDLIDIDGKSVVIPDNIESTNRVVLYYKAVDELIASRDPENPPKVFDHLPQLLHGNWSPVGMMGVGTQGLQLFTTNGKLVNGLNQILNSIQCEYAIRVLGEINDDKLTQLTRGVDLEGDLVRFETIQFAGGEGTNRWYRITVNDGRSGVIRDFLKSQDITCSRVIRIRFGNIMLPEDVKAHAYRELDPDQIAALMELAGLTS